MGSKNTPTAIVSGAGWGMQFLVGVSSGLLAHGWSHEQIHSLVTDEGKDKLECGIDAFVAALVDGPFAPTFDLATGTFWWEVNYDESITAKTAVKDPNSVAWVTDYATDERFPDDRRGKRVVTGRIWYPNRYMGQDALGREAPGTLARPKELIDFSKAFPRPALDEHMPLAAAGQFSPVADGNRYYLCLRRNDTERGLDFVWLSPSAQWGGVWRFLVLDK